jgi:hypothetical protein
MDTTRRMSCRARWLGERFEKPTPHGGPYYKPTEFLGAQQGGGDRQGVVALAHGKAVFDSVPAASLKAGEDRSVLMLDMLEVAELSGLTRGAEPMQKFDGNPVLSADPSADGPSVTTPIVYFDTSRKRYCMRYLTDSGGRRWGSAESRDGVSWKRVAADAEAENPSEFVMPFLDEREPSDERRFKGILYKAYGGEPAGLVVSEDGLTWRLDESVPPERLQLPVETPWGISFLQATAGGGGEYCVVGRTWHEAGRALGVMSSVDLFRWRGGETLLDPAAPDSRTASPHRYASNILESHSGPPEECQIQYGFCHGPIGGMYLLFYAPRSFDGRHGLALATSRDGRHFSRVEGGTVIPCGAGGEWDNGSIDAVSFGGRPCRKGEEFRIYYGGAGRAAGGDPDAGRFRIGFASNVRDRWGYVQLKRDAEIGWLTTIPIDMADAQRQWLFLNVDGMGMRSAYERGGRMAAEFLDAETWQPIKGYTCADCLPIEEDGLDVRVSWKEKRSLPRGRACGVRLRIVIEGWTPKLFAFRFDELGR